MTPPEPRDPFQCPIEKWCWLPSGHSGRCHVAETPLAAATGRATPERLREALADAVHALEGGDIRGGLLAVRVAAELSDPVSDPVTPPEPRPTPHELWTQAEGDRDRYLALMREHGHIVPGKREPGEDIFGHSVIDARPLTAASQVVLDQMASLVETVRALAFPEMVGQPIPQDDLRAALAAIEAEARAEPSTPTDRHGEDILDGRVVGPDRSGAPMTPVTEADLKAEVIKIARANGWLVHHATNSWANRRAAVGGVGMADLILGRDRLIFSELKNATRKLEPEQEDWAIVLRGIAGVEYYLWRPVDLASGAIAAVLA